MKSHDLIKAGVLVGALLIVADGSRKACWAQQTSQPAPASQQVQPLSPAALEALVAPYALYSDSVVERIFDAAQYPSIVHEAARLGASQENWPASVQWVAQQPSLLKQLDANIALTARLGVAAKQQLEDTWRAVDSVRQKMQAAAAAQEQAEDAATQPDQTGTDATGAVAPAVPYSAGVAAALWTDSVWHEVQQYHQDYYQTYGTTQTTTTETPYGTATTTTTTQTSPNGNATVTTGSGSATVTGDGNGTYQGNTTVQTQQGNVSTSTTAGNGQVSTTVDGPNGSNTYTLGDGQVGTSGQSENAYRSETPTRSSSSERKTGVSERFGESGSRANSQRTSSLGRPQSVPGDARFQQFSSRFSGAVTGNAGRSRRSAGHSFGRPSSLSGSRRSLARPSGDARSFHSFGRPSSLGASSARGIKSNRRSVSRGGAARSNSGYPSRSYGSRPTRSRSGGGRRGRR